MADNLLLTCFDSKKIFEFRNDPISPSYQALDHWLSKRDSKQLSDLARDLEIPFDISDVITSFKYMVKSDAKVKLDSGFLTKIPPAQNIMYHKKLVNAMYSQMFDEMKNRIILSLNKNIVLFTEMTNEALADVVRTNLGCDDVYHKGEVDFSKFDKSQDAFIKSFERRFYEFWGMDYALLDMFMQGEKTGFASSCNNDLFFTVENQRRSGGSNTWLGNTIVTLGILAMYYDLSKIALVLVSGDDSLMFSRSPLGNCAFEIAEEMGFETKFVESITPYFCSKFFIFTGIWVYFIPDPYKLLVKLGKPVDDCSPQLLFSLFQSFRDLTVHFCDENVCQRAAYLVCAKYDTHCPSAYSAICAIHCIRANLQAFCRLYDREIGWTSLYLKKISDSLFVRLRRNRQKIVKDPVNGVAIVYREDTSPEELARLALLCGTRSNEV
jgi:hypothetical protein